ncbi:dTDP-4-amino-4,6-dideoxygalactose transaminase [Singulisphaera sp. GP187]|uniref:DegT/DnrJ/EryC1/StrS family aminotransferase n=1 Tax=Singulisphaera sp. GP187 TaxID=1882752 RepID=UPI0009265353|nr:DegT/DnrJ/EryC1/StrS family aminotransferase [Singulisphaera sp. GP187]SIO61536.1 dTDP-4-amino-4,6-dideoxygalactose transaminase [Singulisphaera sp. GP187]
MSIVTEKLLPTLESQPAPSTIPLLDLKAQYLYLREEISRALQDVADSGTYVLGSRVREFEEAFAAHIGARHCVGVNSGTSALHLALITAGVGVGDEVITVPMTFVATTWAISYVGARPVLVDVDPVTYTMDVGQVERKITARTRAILPVHLYGQPADLAPLLEIGRRYGIPVIEDAAQAHDARYHGQGAGTLGFAGCFSFYPGKNLGAYGEAGAIVTDDDCVAARLRRLRDHAQGQRYHHDELGFNYRMDAFQGAVLGVKLRYLDAWTHARHRLAAGYRERLADLPLQLPTEACDLRHAWHLYVVLHPERDRLRCELEVLGISTGLHYPIPVHLQRAYSHLGYREGDFPVAERIARECLSLPLFPEMTAIQQDQVVAAVRTLLREDPV